MPHLGLICPELSGHLNPMTTLGRELQRRGHRVTLIARPDARIKVESRRLRHGLRPLTGRVSESASLAQVAQQPAFFDYPRERLPESFHYTGPWHAIEAGDKSEFPWEKLDGRPLIYASMGTLQNRQKSIFETIAAACAELGGQLVLSLGSRDQELEANFAGRPIVVPFAPQLELLRRAALTITHAGLNTALESLAQRVPMVAIPITNDQPGVASRLEWLGVAEVIQPSHLTVSRLRARVRRVLSEPHYRARAQQWKAEIARAEGLSQAASIVERAIESR
ncbi:MAG: nucleotide disphospho-sugar-binding domain-containing protein [Terrimicrobiaceae bacterium]